MPTRSELLQTFVTWAKAHITGDEKGQAQIFLDRLFIGFGHNGSLDVGGKPEFRIRKSSEDGGGTSFADYVWKPHVLIEMKKRGVKLSKHHRQAFDYWTRLVPNRPRYVVLCNFDEFEVYDFETQMDAPVGRVSLSALPESYGPLAFLFPGQPAPVFNDDRVAVTREAAAKLAKCFNKFVSRGVPRPTAQRFILQTLVALFAEDIGLLEKYFFTRLLDECTDTTAFDLLDGLFKAMNTPTGVKGGRFKGVPYFNGGLFAVAAPIELTGPEIVLLRECASQNWAKVQPEIFGTVFEQTLDKDERHAQGAHFTHPADIMKIIGPTIVEPWREQIENAKTAKRLGDLLQRIQHFHVLDPACGSGNFLYLAYRELKRLEARIFEKLEVFATKAQGQQMRMSYLTALNFHGMDTNPFAVELAKVTMMLARKLAIDELHITEPALPLDNLDSQFQCMDALFTLNAAGDPVRTSWPIVDVVIGNPPFLGSKLLKPKLGVKYVRNLRRAYPEIPGMADFCVYWIRRTHDHLKPCTMTDPLAGRAGLVGTQNIRNNASREGGLSHVVKDGTIVEAVDNQPWSGEANVNVSIANWAKTQEPQLVPAKKKLWSEVDPEPGQKRSRKRQENSAEKEFDLTFREVAKINSSLSDQTDVSGARVLSYAKSDHVVCQGVTPGEKGFVLTPKQATALTDQDSSNSKIIFPYLIGREVLTGDGSPQRSIIDFQSMNILEAQAFEKPFAHVEQQVLPRIKKKAAAEDEDENAYRDHLEKWWTLWRPRSELIQKVSTLERYIVCSRVTKRPIFVFVDHRVRPGDALQCFAFADDYSFGILQSNAHLLWFLTKCSKLTKRLRYTPESVFDTFPWPQNPASSDVLAVAEAGRRIREIRAKVLPTIRGGLRGLYRTLEIAGSNPLKDAHATLDRAVIKAYGFDVRTDLLLQLLQLNEQVTAAISKGGLVTAPGVPKTFSNMKQLLSTDRLGIPS